MFPSDVLFHVNEPFPYFWSDCERLKQFSEAFHGQLLKGFFRLFYVIFHQLLVRRGAAQVKKFFIFQVDFPHLVPTRMTLAQVLVIGVEGSLSSLWFQRPSLPLQWSLRSSAFFYSAIPHRDEPHFHLVELHPYRNFGIYPF